MEGGRQERLGSRAGTHREEEKNKNILTKRKEKIQKNTLDSYRPSHGRTWPRSEMLLAAALNLIFPSRNLLLQLFKPVQHDVDLRRPLRLCSRLEHQEVLSVGRNIVVWK